MSFDTNIIVFGNSQFGYGNLAEIKIVDIYFSPHRHLLYEICKEPYYPFKTEMLLYLNFMETNFKNVRKCVYFL